MSDKTTSSQTTDVLSAAEHRAVTGGWDDGYWMLKFDGQNSYTSLVRTAANVPIIWPDLVFE